MTIKYSRPQPLERLAARDILKKYYVKQGTPSLDEFFPVRLKDLAESVLRWQVEETPDLGATEYGERVTGKCIFENKQILLLSETQGPEKRFSLAHEIGHVALHKEAPACRGGVHSRTRSSRPLRRKIWDTVKQELERQADAFASELLMPERAVRKHFRELFARERVWKGSSTVLERVGCQSRYDQPTVQSVSECLATVKPSPDQKSLTDYFGVSKAAMSIRLRELGLVY